MAYDNRPVGVAEYYLCAHIYQLVNEEQAAFKHLLVEENAAARLGCHHYKHRYEVGSQPRPRRICQSHDRAVDECLHVQVALLWNNEVVALHIYTHSEPPEGIRYYSEVA